MWLFRKKRIRYLHESGLAIAYGLAVGLVIALISEGEPISKRVVVLLDEEESRTAEGGVAASSSAFPPDELIFKVNQSVLQSEGASQVRQTSWSTVLTKFEPKPITIITWVGKYCLVKGRWDIIWYQGSYMVNYASLGKHTEYYAAVGPAYCHNIVLGLV